MANRIRPLPMHQRPDETARYLPSEEEIYREARLIRETWPTWSEKRLQDNEQVVPAVIQEVVDRGGGRTYHKAPLNNNE